MGSTWEFVTRTQHSVPDRGPNPDRSNWDRSRSSHEAITNTNETVSIKTEKKNNLTKRRVNRNYVTLLSDSSQSIGSYGHFVCNQWFQSR